MALQQHVNLFVIDGQQYAIPIQIIARVIRAVEVTTVPNAPAYLLGLIDYHGNILPVLDFRNLLGLPSRDIDIDDRIMIIEIRNKTIAIVVDSLSDILSIDEDKMLSADSILPNSKIKKMIRLESGIVFLLDFEQILNQNELLLLDGLINKNNFNSVA